MCIHSDWTPHFLKFTELLYPGLKFTHEGAFIINEVNKSAYLMFSETPVLKSELRGK